MASLKHPYTITIDDVARQAGVSISTVSRVLNQKIPVAEETAARVHAAITELNYIPRTAARNLANRQTNTLGLLLTDIHGDFFTPMLTGIEAVAHEAGFELLISTAAQRQGPRVQVPQSLGPHNTDGLLIFADSVGETGIAALYKLGFPLILIHQAPPQGMDIPCVTIENKAASRKLVEHLIEVHSCRRIAFLRGPQGNEDSYWREIGYQEALAAHAIPLDPRLVASGEFDRAHAEASVKKMLATREPLDAIFAGDDEAAVGVLEALQDAGKKVPEDIAVVGFDDQRLSAYLTPPLTTVRAPTELVGRVATQQLVQLIRTREADPLTLLPTAIIIRRSCGCQPSTI